uniref:Potassium transporter n=1 Tax=Leersia perrieri TaxID=77586 RepID=A0A0D9X9M4_9ORYZ
MEYHNQQQQQQPDHDDVVIQVNASAIAAVDERSSTNEVEDDVDYGAAADCAGRGLSRRTFSHAYKMKHREPLEFTKWQLALLSYQSLGVVYGDLGTSPLYVFSSISLPNPGEQDFLGILSIILWTFTLICLVKYVFIVLKADDHGEGGTFALYSLLRQHVNFKGNMPVPVTQLASDSNLKFHSKKKRTSKYLNYLEESTKLQAVITCIVLTGTCMVIGDGALTPAISAHVVLLSVIILFVLFFFQKHGTSKVSFTFSPIMLLWFAFVAFIGLYNIIKYYPPILKAVSPHYIIIYFLRNKKAAWETLGAIVLCITGVAVIFVMLFTTILMVVIMAIIWETNIAYIGAYFVAFFSIEGIYMTSLMNKLLQGGWVPFAITAFFLTITLSWTYGRSKKSDYEQANVVKREEFIKTATTSSRVPGACIFCTDMMNGIPPIVRHYLQHVASLRELTVFVTVRTLPVRTVLPEERFLIDKLEPVGVYRCIVRYGYMDNHNMEGDEYVATVIASLKEIAENDDEILVLDSALINGSSFVVGRTIIKMSPNHNCFKRFFINNLYRFLQKNFRSNMSSLKINPGKTLQVGMQYEI